MKFKLDRAAKESAMIWYFRKDLKSLLRVEIEQRGRKFNSFDEICKKAVNADTKAVLRLLSSTHETDQHCAQENCPIVTKFYDQGPSRKDLKAEKLKAQP